MTMGQDIGLPEYWIVDPDVQQVTVLHLDGETYGEVGVFRGEESVVSVEVPEVALTVAEVLGRERV